MGLFARHDPLTGEPPSRHPFQVWVLAACVVSGASTTLKWGSPRTLEVLLPPLLVLAWGVTLMVGGALGLIGAWYHDPITGRLMERIALLGIGGMSVVYAVVIFKIAGGVGVVSGCLLLAIGGASMWRIRQLNREIKVYARWQAQKALFRQAAPDDPHEQWKGFEE